MADATTAELDAAVLAYRDDPTPGNRARLDAAQRAHVERFHRRQADEFIERTRAPRPRPTS